MNNFAIVVCTYIKKKKGKIQKPSLRFKLMTEIIKTL